MLGRLGACLGTWVIRDTTGIVHARQSPTKSNSEVARSRLERFSKTQLGPFGFSIPEMTFNQMYMFIFCAVLSRCLLSARGALIRREWETNQINETLCSWYQPRGERWHHGDEITRRLMNDSKPLSFETHFILTEVESLIYRALPMELPSLTRQVRYNHNKDDESS